jgi:segregation and condensation protein B
VAEWKEQDEQPEGQDAQDVATGETVPADEEVQSATEPVEDAFAATTGLDGDESAIGESAIAETDEDFTRPAAELKAIVEAMIFASPEPLTPKALTKLLDNEPKEDVLAALDELKTDYERPGGLQLVEVAGGFQIVTRPDLHEWVRRLFHERSTQKLSVPALETLAVIAYRQPITALEINEIRGVSASGVLNTLLERHLIKIVGRKQVVGRPFMYATTKEFLIRFGLKDLSDLPKVEDMAESLGIESSLLVEQTPPEEQLPLSEPETDVSSDDFASEPVAPESDDDDSGPSVH